MTRILRTVANGQNLFRPLSAGDLADFKFTGTGGGVSLRMNVSGIYQTAMSPRKCDASTIQYPSQLSAADGVSEMISRITEITCPAIA